ncbi:MAG: hypothetical protein M0009_14840 [Deltaproteobacteria bacterium]|nr:hypothetical protein [Deltaproteobacteria bacterium]
MEKNVWRRFRPLLLGLLALAMLLPDMAAALSASDHFRDIRDYRLLRSDPLSLLEDSVFGGIGVSRFQGLFTTGVPQGERRFINRPPPRVSSSIRVAQPRSSTNRMVTPPTRSGMVNGPIAPCVGSASVPDAGGASVVIPSTRSGRTLPQLDRPSGNRRQRSQPQVNRPLAVMCFMLLQAAAGPREGGIGSRSGGGK